MNKEEIAPGIMLYENVIKKYDYIPNDIESAVSLGLVSWTPTAVRKDQDSVIDTKIRDCDTIGIVYNSNPEEDLSSPAKSFFSTLQTIFFNAFDPLEKDYMVKYGISTTWHDTYGILKYGKGQQFINHIDDHTEYHRRISTVYYLNENYLGGEINFPRFKITLKPKADQMIIFPSTYVYNHSVSPVTEGYRYSVVSWLK